LNGWLITSKDHPHGRGEQRSASSGVPRSKGPSPRARGAEPSGRSSSGPASGSPSGRGSTRSQWTTPRMLGTDCRAVRRLAHPGNIPAGAGNRGGPSVFGKGGRPRECEEQVLQVNGIGNVEGSSPRARGTGAHAGSAYRRGGIIPTGAGSSWSCCAPSRRTKNHPRRHGKQSMRMLPAPMIAGPSPEARGAVEPHVALGRRSRDQSREHGEQWGKGVEEQKQVGTIPAGARSSP